MGQSAGGVLSLVSELPPGIPAQDTFTRVFAMRKPATLHAVLLPWLLERRGLPGEWIHLDGKRCGRPGAPRRSEKRSRW